MNIPRITAVAALVAAPVLGLAAPAVAHDGSHPFENCSAAYAAGYSNIPSGDEHYARKLDRDGDGWGCDDQVKANDGKAETGGYGKSDDASTPAPSESAKEDKALAETGGDSTTPYVATAGAVLLVGGAVLVVRRKRQTV